jgi:hypothetical protein
MRTTSALTAAAAVTVALAVPSLASATTTAGDVYSATSSNVAWSFNGQNMTCSAVDLGGTVQSGTNPAATIESARTAWGGCLYSGQDLDITMNNNTWSLVADTGYTSGADTSVASHISSISMHWSLLGGLCTYTVTGSMQASFNEATQTLQVNETAAHGGLTVSGTSFGCFGLWTNGSHANFSGTFAISAPHAINIS